MATTTREDETLLSLKQIEQAAAFSGFEAEDFSVFEAPDLSRRMPLLKQRITPKLKLAASALTERLGGVVEEVVFPHVALHLRRSVNPPIETWAAFARNARAYKPFVHLRFGVSIDKVRVSVFVEDYADDKQLFATNLGRNAREIAAWCALHPTIHAYDILDAAGEPRHGHALNATALRAFARRMRKIKGQHARFGIAFANTHPIVSNGPECLEAVVEAARLLRPFYDCGKPNFVFTCVAEPIALP